MASETMEYNDGLKDDTRLEKVNHRTIVGRRRRANTETKIIRAAVQVFAEHGVDAPVIDDFIKAAGIARGTFYNYFKSTEELLQASSDLLSEELVERIHEITKTLKDAKALNDAAMRFGVSTRLWMSWAQANPSWCLFNARVWNSVKYERPFQDIREGIRKKLFKAPDAYVAWDVISGAIRQSMYRIGEGNVRRDYGDAVAQMCLQALGANPETISKIMAFALPETPRQ